MRIIRAVSARKGYSYIPATISPSFLDHVRDGSSPRCEVRMNCSVLRLSHSSSRPVCVNLDLLPSYIFGLIHQTWKS
ncbi:hypothetical protein M378DRAFT_370455 [Amanita muscaria Koide BX008]|uniref:Uncharacterized protein n=1 Tax=Amanita muscaria (strain Koide BX008) TaxID=946122 RepID=A0A0C2WXT6_AMAMK|nr:hypothetical protein M378DRAFT_370455 [Amanita muscaria Koide BX008]